MEGITVYSLTFVLFCKTFVLLIFMVSLFQPELFKSKGHLYSVKKRKESLSKHSLEKLHSCLLMFQTDSRTL